MHCRQSRGHRQRADANSVADCERAGNDVKRIRAALECLERGRNLFGLPDFEGGDFKRLGGGPNLAYLQRGIGTVTIG